jgi:hypothetical protein
MNKEGKTVRMIAILNGHTNYTMANARDAARTTFCRRPTAYEQARLIE